MTTLYPGAPVGTCSVCGCAIHVYYQSKLYRPDEPLPPVDTIPLWWQQVCLCGWRDYQAAAVPEQLSLLEAV